jgi:hypothetical protein
VFSKNELINIIIITIFSSLSRKNNTINNLGSIIHQKLENSKYDVYKITYIDFMC